MKDFIKKMEEKGDPMSKFKKKLVEGAREQEKVCAAQKHLKAKYKIRSDQDVLIVEKSGLIKYLLQMCENLIKFLAGLILFLLALIGLTALVYPETRTDLLYQWYLTMAQLKSLI